jgi:hypothetical protein
MYATSSTNDSSSLVEAYFVAFFQNPPLWGDFSTIFCSDNIIDYQIIG